MEVVEGKVTPGHRLVTLDAEQQESVAFGELVAQYPQRPERLVENPQSFDSFSSPVTQPVLNESDGSAQLVKSALIWSMNPCLGLPQSCRCIVMPSSLVACWACCSLAGKFDIK